jgi:hypothetical protein
MFSTLRIVLLLGLQLGASTAAAGVGWIDTHFSSASQGYLRVAFDLGGNFETVGDVRTLDDGRVMAVGMAYTGSNWRVAVTVRRPDGVRDVTINPQGGYAFAPVGGQLGGGVTAFAIAPDGSYFVVGIGGDELRIWRHAIDGSLLAGPFPVAVEGRVLRADSALVDAQGRLLVAGRIKPTGADDALTDAFVLRLQSDGGLDPAFGLRELSFEPARRDDGHRLREVGDGGYVLCSRVGDLDGSLLGYGLARLTANGALHPDFNGGQLLVHFLSVDGFNYDAACHDLGVLRTSTVLRFYIAGRAFRSGEAARSFVRVHLGDGSVFTNFGGNGQVLLDFGIDRHIDGFPLLQVGQSADDVGRAYVISSARLFEFDPASRSVLVTRLNSLGSVDSTWGEAAGVTVVPFLVPDPSGVQRPHYQDAAHLAADGLLLAGNVTLTDGSQDWTLVRLTGYRSFRDGFE